MPTVVFHYLSEPLQPVPFHLLYLPLQLVSAHEGTYPVSWRRSPVAVEAPRESEQEKECQRRP